MGNLNRRLRVLWVGLSATVAVGIIIFGSMSWSDHDAKAQVSSVDIEVAQEPSSDSPIHYTSALTFTPMLTVYLPIVQSSRHDIPLLETNWGQRNEYARFSPDNLRLGCWSTAIAQILYFHRLRPSGSVSYQCTTGYSINENLDSYTFDWNLFVNEFDDSTPEASINEVARYVYFTSVVVQKDFGTGSYILSHSERAAAVADHYNCEAQLYDNWSYSLDQIKQIIVQELDAHRPVMMHLRDLSHNSYHAVAIDAYRIENSEFWVHINMGHEGSDNGWYNFDSPILHYDDNSYRKIMTIKPIDHCLGITKTVTPETDVTYRDVVTYTVVLSNNGTTDDAGGTLLTDTLPGEVDFARWVEQPAGTDWPPTKSSGMGRSWPIRPSPLPFCHTHR